MTSVRRILTGVALGSLFLTACTIAKAGTLATLPNESNGEIRLSDTPCRDGVTLQAMAYGKGPVIYGCWTADDGLVMVRWENRPREYAYPIADFTITPYGETVKVDNP